MDRWLRQSTESLCHSRTSTQCTQTEFIPDVEQLLRKRSQTNLVHKSYKSPGAVVTRILSCKQRYFGNYLQNEATVSKGRLRPECYVWTHQRIKLITQCLEVGSALVTLETGAKKVNGSGDTAGSHEGVA